MCLDKHLSGVGDQIHFQMGFGRLPTLAQVCNRVLTQGEEGAGGMLVGACNQCPATSIEGLWEGNK